MVIEVVSTTAGKANLVVQQKTGKLDRVLPGGGLDVLVIFNRLMPTSDLDYYVRNDRMTIKITVK